MLSRSSGQGQGHRSKKCVLLADDLHSMERQSCYYAVLISSTWWADGTRLNLWCCTNYWNLYNFNNSYSIINLSCEWYPSSVSSSSASVNSKLFFPSHLAISDFLKNPVWQTDRRTDGRTNLARYMPRFAAAEELHVPTARITR